MCLFFLLFELHSPWMLAFPISLFLSLFLHSLLGISHISFFPSPLPLEQRLYKVLCLYPLYVSDGNRWPIENCATSRFQRNSKTSQPRIRFEWLIIPLRFRWSWVRIPAPALFVADAFYSYFKLHWLKINTKFYAAKGQWTVTNAETLNKVLLWNLLNFYRVLLEQVWSGSRKNGR